MSRKAKLIVMCGVPGTGKTTFAIENLLPINRRNLIFPANRLDKAWAGYRMLNWENVLRRTANLSKRDVKLLERDKYRGQRDKFFTEMGNAFWRVRGTVICPASANELPVFRSALDQDDGFKKGMLFVDDFTTFCLEGKLPNDMKVLISEMRHRELDIVLAAHNPDFVPPRVFGYNPKLIIFQTSTPFKKVYDKGVWSKEQWQQAEAVRERVNRIAALGEKYDDHRKFYCETLEIQAIGEGE